jgi:uncharacterized damage-inducible protein DinB
MDAATFHDLFAYHRWANARVWDCLVALDDERFTRDLDYSVGSLRAQVLHAIAVEWWWVAFLRTGELDFLDQDAYPDRDAIATLRAETDARTLAYLAGLTADELDRPVRPDFWPPEHAAIPVRDALLQVINHSTDHRAQTLAGLHAVGGATTEQDYLSWLVAGRPATGTGA